MEQFIVSARKYRPDTFESLIGQENIARTLKNSIIRGQLAHAYLFCGPRGVGKTTTARIFAKSINCLNPGPDMEPCGKCESCLSFAEGRSYCIHELDAASNNSVDDIRNLTDMVRIPPQVGKYSVYIIDEVHMLSSAAFNAFLKTLEEPPAHAIFILATTEKHKILPTILSRCQTFDFNRISVPDIVRNLTDIASKEGITIDSESLHVIAVKADGAMRDALTIFDQIVAFCGKEVRYEDVIRDLNVLDYEYYFKIIDNSLSGDYTSSLLLLDEILSKGFNALYLPPPGSAGMQELPRLGPAVAASLAHRAVPGTGGKVLRPVHLLLAQYYNVMRGVLPSERQPAVAHRVRPDAAGGEGGRGPAASAGSTADRRTTACTTGTGDNHGSRISRPAPPASFLSTRTSS